jgi:DNA-binding NtrC family response regulator
MSIHPKKLPQVLICDDDQTFHLAVKYCLKGKYDCKSVQNGDEALLLLRKEPFDLVLLDIQMRTPTEGLDYLPRIKEAQEEADVIMTSALSDFSTVREAMRRGATDYVPKDFDPTELAITIERVTERRRLLRRREQSSSEIARVQEQHHALVGESSSIRELKKTIERVRDSDANVIITGETGCGKEVVARQLRGRSPDGVLLPFVAVDSSTIQSATAESRLFGHEKGAFTGADQAAKGLFEEANGGIIYFDEIANMPLDIQAKLLRVIQEQEITRMGSTRTIQLSFRVIAATNRDLEEMSKKGEFKYDLYQRLNVIPLRLPALRDRKEDIPLLTQHFVLKSKKRTDLSFTEEALAALRSYDWPGNVRELANVVSYVATMAPTNTVEPADLPPWLREFKPSLASVLNTPEAEGSFYDRVARFERKILADSYQAVGGNISKLALELGMDRSHLYTKLREYGIHTSKK